MKCLELDGELRRQGIAPLYAVTGEEDYLRDRAVGCLRRAAQGESGPEEAGLEAFNEIVLYGDESDGAEILGAAREVPIFSSRRLVVLKAAEKLPAREAERLLPYLKEPCDSTTLVVVSAKLDGRLKFTQALKEAAVSVDCSPLPEAQLLAWLRSEVARLGLTVTEEGMQRLKELATESLYLVRNELDKLKAYLPEGAPAGVAEIELLRGGVPGASVFDLTVAMAARDQARVLRILQRNLEAGEAPVRILGSLIWQYRRLWKAKALLAEGRSEQELTRLVGIPPYRLREFVAQLRQFPAGHLRAAFDLFLRADSDLKGGAAGNGGGLLETLLLELCASLEAAGKSSRATSPPTSGRPAMRTTSNVRTVRTGRTPSR